MNEKWAKHWESVLLAAEAKASEDTGDIAALLAVAMMCDALENNLPVPQPTPEFNKRLARAEVLAA